MNTYVLRWPKFSCCWEKPRLAAALLRAFGWRYGQDLASGHLFALSRLFLTFISTYGVLENEHSRGLVDRELRLGDLFGGVMRGMFFFEKQILGGIGSSASKTSSRCCLCIL